jgi:hypothetical protein
VLKKIIIMLISEGTHNVRRLKLHGFLLPLAIATLLSALALSGF